jgi:prolyl oligopeptidase
MRHWIMAIVGALPVAVFAQPVGTGLTNFADVPKAEPFTETVFGITVADPYRWMERADRRTDLESWVNAASLHTTRELAALPGREALFKDLEAASRASAIVRSVRAAGDKVF